MAKDIQFLPIPTIRRLLGIEGSIRPRLAETVGQTYSIQDLVRDQFARAIERVYTVRVDAGAPLPGANLSTGALVNPANSGRLVLLTDLYLWSRQNPVTLRFTPASEADIDAIPITGPAPLATNWRNALAQVVTDSVVTMRERVLGSPTFFPGLDVEADPTLWAHMPFSFPVHPGFGIIYQATPNALQARFSLRWTEVDILGTGTPDLLDYFQAVRG